MIAKWEITVSPSEKDLQRRKVRLSAEKADLEPLLRQISGYCTRPFVTLSKDFNWCFYVSSLSQEEEARLAEILGGGAPSRPVHGENRPSVLQAAEKILNAPPETPASPFAAVEKPLYVEEPPAPPAPEQPVEETAAEDPAIIQNIEVAGGEGEKMGTGVMDELVSIPHEPAPALDTEPPAILPVEIPALAPVAAEEKMDEPDSGIGEIVLVEYVGFFPEGFETFYAKIQPALDAFIRKFKLKIRLSETGKTSYQYEANMDCSFLHNACTASQCRRAVVLGPWPQAGVDERKFQKALLAAAEADHVTLHFVSWNSLTKDSDLMNCALEMTIPVSRLNMAVARARR